MTTLLTYISSSTDKQLVSDIMSFLKEHNIRTSMKTTCADLLCEVAKREDEALLNKLIEDEIMKNNINEVDCVNGSTVLMHVAQIGLHQSLKNLLDKGAKTHVNNKSALYYALETSLGVDNMQEKFKCAEELIKANADIELVNNYGRYTYHLAKYFHSKLMIDQERSKYSLKWDGVSDMPIPEIVLTIPKIKMFPDIESIPKRIGILLEDTEVNIENYSNDGVKSILVKGTRIEIPESKNDRSLYHQLPVGMAFKRQTVQSGSCRTVILSVPQFCRITRELIVQVDTEIIKLSNIYQ